MQAFFLKKNNNYKSKGLSMHLIKYIENHVCQ